MYNVFNYLYIKESLNLTIYHKTNIKLYICTYIVFNYFASELNCS